MNAFTKVYPKLAERSPVYAQLRNCIDLAVAAAFIRDQDFYSLAKWKPSVFEDEAAYPVETLNPPKQVASAVNSMWKGSMLVTPIGGGVQMRPTEAISPTNLLDDEEKTGRQGPHRDRSLAPGRRSMVVGLSRRARLDFAAQSAQRAD